MTFLISFLENQALGFFIGTLAGAFGTAFVVGAARCENCCWNSENK